MKRTLVRKATVDDIPSIVHAGLTSASKKETDGFAAPEWVTYSSPKELKKIWGTGNTLNDGSEVIVAEKDGKVIGFIVFKLENECAYIDNIDIVKHEQRKGIGRDLVAYVEKAAKTKGYSRVETDTTENAEGVAWKSYGFWTKMGFKDSGKRLPTKWSFKTIPFEKKLE